MDKDTKITKKFFKSEYIPIEKTIFPSTPWINQEPFDFRNWIKNFDISRCKRFIDIQTIDIWNESFITFVPDIDQLNDIEYINDNSIDSIFIPENWLYRISWKIYVDNWSLEWFTWNLQFKILDKDLNLIDLIYTDAWLKKEFQFSYVWEFKMETNLKFNVLNENWDTCNILSWLDTFCLSYIYIEKLWFSSIYG